VHPFQLIPGFSKLDSSIKHFLGGELVVISGPTKHGKTLLSQTFTRNFSDQGHMGTWFTYEVPAYQFLQQFDNPLPVFAMPKTLKDNSLSWIIERTHEAKLKHNIKYIVIDNTHNVINLTTNNLSQFMGEFLKAVKKMALKFNIVVFLLHHLTKIKLGDDDTIDSSLLRDSSLVAQTADTVMFVWRDKDTIQKPNRGYIKITENRRYGIMNLVTPIIKIGNYLEECEIHL
jgi:replicative DNA helicase